MGVLTLVRDSITREAMEKLWDAHLGEAERLEKKIDNAIGWVWKEIDALYDEVGKLRDQVKHLEDLIEELEDRIDELEDKLEG